MIRKPTAAEARYFLNWLVIALGLLGPVAAHAGADVFLEDLILPFVIFLCIVIGLVAGVVVTIFSIRDRDKKPEQRPGGLRKALFVIFLSPIIALGIIVGLVVIALAFAECSHNARP